MGDSGGPIFFKHGGKTYLVGISNKVVNSMISIMGGDGKRHKLYVYYGSVALLSLFDKVLALSIVFTKVS